MNIRQKFKLINIDDLTNKQLFLDFCQKEFEGSTDPSGSNMWASDWESNPHTLPNLIYTQKRFSSSRGQFSLLLADDEIIGCAGVYASEFCSDFAIAGCRTWISAPHRNALLVREYLLPKQKSWARDNKLSAVGLTFNEYNKNLAKIWEKRRLGEKRTAREPHHMFYNNFQQVKFPVIIQNTAQWVIYETLSKNWNFDWGAIKCK